MGFDRLVGHRRAKELLRGALTRAAVHTGYLFVGPAGVGKRLAAEEFVRAWLCPEGSGEACGVCDSCRQAAAATHPDFCVVAPEERKKFIGIEQVRDLGSWIAQSPALGRRKAAILDPADALRVEGANALLKTLEEPPPGRVIVLIATHPGALPPTVRSRCQQVSFGSLSEDEVAEVLRRHGWPAQSALLAAAAAEGSPGSALERDGRAGQDATAAASALFEAIASDGLGAALAFAETAGEARERAVNSLRAIIGFSRLAARRLLGDRGVDPAAVPPLLARLGPEQLGGFLERALEAQRRLEGDRPPNPKLALATLLVRAADRRVPP